MNNNLQSLADNLMGYCQKELGFKEPPSLFFQEDPKNAEDTLGRTAHYEPATKKVVVFVTGRHNKDILRSIAHELIHHVQNLRGEFDNDHDTSPGYAQKDSHMRNMEKEAYLLGNLLFRDWEDGLKSKRMQENKEINPVNDNNIKELIKNALLEELSEKNDEDYFRTPLDKDEKLKKSINRQIQSTVDFATGKKKPARPPMKEEEELEEGEERKRADNEPPHPYDPGQYHGQDRDSTGKKIKKEVHNMNIDTIKEMIKEKLLEALKNEAAKPDFLDLDKDGDKKEPMKDAAKDAKGDDDEKDKEEVNEAAHGKKDDEALEEDWGGSSRPSDRGGYGWNRGSSGNESKCAAEAQRKTGTNHGPAYTRAKNDCLSRGQSYSNFEESNSEEATATIEEQEILEEDFWSQAQKHAEKECRHLSGDSYGMCFRREADAHYSYLIKQSQSGGGSSRYGSRRDHLISFYEGSEEQGIFAPNHYCIHHGGVQHNGSVQMAEAVSHNYNKELGRVTHYDMKLEDGTILEGVAAEDIQVTNASLANEHMHAVRDDDEEEKKMQEADLDEIMDQNEAPYPGETPEQARERAKSDRKSQRKKEGKPVEEGKIQTPEQENLLYEARFEGRDTDLFNRLVNKWIK